MTPRGWRLQLGSGRGPGGQWLKEGFGDLLEGTVQGCHSQAGLWTLPPPHTHRKAPWWTERREGLKFGPMVVIGGVVEGLLAAAPCGPSLSGPASQQIRQ